MQKYSVPASTSSLHRGTTLSRGHGQADKVVWCMHDGNLPSISDSSQATSESQGPHQHCRLQERPLRQECPLTEAYDRWHRNSTSGVVELQLSQRAGKVRSLTYEC